MIAAAKIFLVGAVAYLAIAVFMYARQRSFIYFPDPQRTPPADAGLQDAHERILETPDGARIVTWYAEAKQHQPTLLYFHGNAGSLEMRSDRMRHFVDSGRGMLMMAYRSYAGSTGEPTEENIAADARLAYDTLLNGGMKPEDIILYGESLGAAVAVRLASERPIGGIILDSPFTSLIARARLSYPWLPIGWLLKDRYLSVEYIKSVHAPVLIVHGEQDDVTPVAMGRALFAAANPPKELITLPGAGHSDIGDFGAYEKIDAWIDRVAAGARR